MSSPHIEYIREALDELAVIPYCTSEAMKRNAVTQCIECIRYALPIYEHPPEDTAYAIARTSAVRGIELLTYVLERKKEFEAVALEVSQCFEVVGDYLTDNKKRVAHWQPCTIFSKL